MTRALIVDWGGVLTVPLEDAMRAWTQAEGMPYDEVMSLLDWYVPTTDDEVHIIHALERGESGPNSWRSGWRSRCATSTTST